MSNPLKVSLENIIPLTYARDHFSQIVSEVQQDKLFVLTKGGTPAVAIIDVKYLESITGGQVDREDVKEEIKKDPEKVGLPEMIKHTEAEDKEIRDEKLDMDDKPKDKPVIPAPITPPKPFENTPPKPAGFAAPMTPKPISPQPAVQPKPAGFAAPMSTPAKPINNIPKPPLSSPTPTPPPPPSMPKVNELKPVEPPTDTAQDNPKPYSPPSNMPPKPTPLSPSPAMPSNNTISKTSPSPWTTYSNKPTTPAPKPADTLVMPSQNEPAIPNKPLTTLPPVKKEEPKPPVAALTDQVDVQFSPDLGNSSAGQKQSDKFDLPPGSNNNPDDQNPPAQYAGETIPKPKPAAGTPGDDLDEMAID